MAGKYWIANNPNSQVTDAEAQKVEELSATDVSLAQLNSIVVLDASVAGNAYGLNMPSVTIGGGAGNDTTIHSLQSGKIHYFGTTNGVAGAPDDDDAFTLKLPSPVSFGGERIEVYPVNAAAYDSLLGITVNNPATETIRYYAVAQNVFIESATTVVGTHGTNNTMIKLNGEHFQLGMKFVFTSMSSTTWRLDIDDPLNLIAAGDIAVDPGNAGGYID